MAAGFGSVEPLVYAVLTTPWYFCTCILHTFDLKAKSHQNSSKCHFTFAFQHCLLTTRVGYIWDRRLNLSVICWAGMCLWRREVSFALRGSSFEHLISGRYLLSHWCNLLLCIYLILPYSYCAKVTVAIEQMYRINFFCKLWLAMYMTEFKINL